MKVLEKVKTPGLFLCPPPSCRSPPCPESPVRSRSTQIVPARPGELYPRACLCQLPCTDRPVVIRALSRQLSLSHFRLFIANRTLAVPLQMNKHLSLCCCSVEGTELPSSAPGGLKHPEKAQLLLVLKPSLLRVFPSQVSCIFVTAHEIAWFQLDLQGKSNKAVQEVHFPVSPILHQKS